MALRHPIYGQACRAILQDLTTRRLVGYGSILVLAEILGSLAEVDPKIAKGAVETYLSLPISLIPLDPPLVRDAGIIAETARVSYDAIHAAAIGQAGIPAIITEDVDHWSKIRAHWGSIRLKAGFAARELTVIRPLQYEEWTKTLNAAR